NVEFQGRTCGRRTCGERGPGEAGLPDPLSSYRQPHSLIPLEISAEGLIVRDEAFRIVDKKERVGTLPLVDDDSTGDFCCDTSEAGLGSHELHLNEEGVFQICKIWARCDCTEWELRNLALKGLKRRRKHRLSNILDLRFL